MRDIKFHNDNVYSMGALELGPFKMYQIGDLCCNANYDVDEHVQICYEISLIVSGKGYFTTNGIENLVTEGIVYVNVPGQKHYIRSDKEDPFRYFYIGFWFNEENSKYEKFKEIREFFDSLSKYMTIDKTGIFHAFTHTLGELLNRDNLMPEMLEGFITQIIIMTYRLFRHSLVAKYSPTIKDRSEDDIVYDIVNYIDNDACNLNQLSKLSQSLGYSYPYLSQVFSKHMNESIQQYFRKRLFDKAINMLENGNSITSISAELGYNSSYSFSRAFVNYVGVNPSTYRNNKESLQKTGEQFDAKTND